MNPDDCRIALDIYQNGVLSHTQKRVLEGRFIEGRTLHELGKEFGRSHTWVTNVQKRAIYRIQRKMAIDKINSELGANINLSSDDSLCRLYINANPVS